MKQNVVVHSYRIINLHKGRIFLAPATANLERFVGILDLPSGIVFRVVAAFVILSLIASFKASAT